MKEICICAAIKMPDGYIIRGHRHNDCYRTASQIPRYKGLHYDNMPDGFVTSKNRFVDRNEAVGLQIAAGISPKRKEGYQNILYSEDLY